MTETLKLNLDEAWTFVSNMSRSRMVHLAAIAEGEKLAAASFEPNEASHAATWITEQAGKNIYFHVNALRADVKNKKATKEDVEEVLALHTDIDNPEAFELLDNFPLRPTAVVASGGARQAFWLLREPLRDLALAERLNKAIADLCGGDHCWNVDRLMRVPGTVNVPNAKKRAAGRVPVLAYVIEADWKRVYNAEDFLPFDPGPESPSTALVPADLMRIGRDDLPEGVLPAMLSLLENGDDPGSPARPAEPAPQVAQRERLSRGLRSRPSGLQRRVHRRSLAEPGTPNLGICPREAPPGGLRTAPGGQSARERSGIGKIASNSEG